MTPPPAPRKGRSAIMRHPATQLPKRNAIGFAGSDRLAGEKPRNRTKSATRPIAAATTAAEAIARRPNRPPTHQMVRTPATPSAANPPKDPLATNAAA